MTNLQFNYNHEKSTQALNYFAIQNGGTINKMKALKLIFLADRYHIRKYGRTVTNDNYVAMKHGPVPSVTKDLIESSDFLDDDQVNYAKEYVVLNNYDFKSVKDLEKKVFSESDLEALAFAWDSFGKYTQYQLKDITHQYPEWIRLKHVVECGSSAPMRILDFLKEPDEEKLSELGVDKKAGHTFELNDEEREVRSEDIKERNHIISLWR